MENILKVENLSTGFFIDDKFYFAINDINLSFEKGKIHALAGESGCGKSVFISSILRLLPKNAKITSGKILFQNEDLLEIKEKDFNKIRGKKIALIPQDPFMSLNPLYKIENQLLEVTSLKGLNKKEALEIVKNALDEVKIKNIDTVLKSYPHELSGGMKQRVIIACALISKADLILADEVTTALDVSVSNSILNLLLDLKNKGKTIILITHDLSIVSNYCDTATIMYLGDIVEKNYVDDLFKNPKHPYTKALLKALPTNKKQKLESIKGQISPITEIISGCKFHPRCNYAMEICKNIKPEFKCFENANSIACVRCHLFDE